MQSLAKGRNSASTSRHARQRKVRKGGKKFMTQWAEMRAWTCSLDQKRRVCSDGGASRDMASVASSMRPVPGRTIRATHASASARRCGRT